jgi:hypothetical protein
MVIAKCRKAFEQKQKDQLSFPLKSGVYKIKEVCLILKSWNNNIDILAESKNKKRKPPMMCHCTAEDSYKWLKDIPLVIASEFMGYKILPGLHALRGDEVSEETVNKIKTTYIPEIDKFIDECDEVELRLRKNIGLEYQKWKYGQSDLKTLINKALSIVDGILNYVESGKENAVCPKFPCGG